MTISGVRTVPFDLLILLGHTLNTLLIFFVLRLRCKENESLCQIEAQADQTIVLKHFFQNQVSLIRIWGQYYQSPITFVPHNTIFVKRMDYLHIMIFFRQPYKLWRKGYKRLNHILIFKLPSAELLQNICFPHLACAQQYEGLPVGTVFPVQQIFIDGSFHCYMCLPP